jgi:hypothetical protein
MKLISEECLTSFYNAIYNQLAVTKDGKVIGTRTIPIISDKRLDLSEELEDLFDEDQIKLRDNQMLLKGLLEYLKTPAPMYGRTYAITSIQGVKGGLYLVGLPKMDRAFELDIDKTKEIISDLVSKMRSVNVQLVCHSLGLPLDDKNIKLAFKAGQFSNFKMNGDNIESV